MASEYSVVPFTKGTEVLESYLFATSSRSLSIYSERLLLELVRLAQVQLAGANFRDGTDIGQISIGQLGEVQVEVPIRNIIGEGNTNYTQAKRAIVELMRSPYFAERQKVRGGKVVIGSDGKPEYEFVGFQLLNSCEVNVKPGMAVIEVNKETWRLFLDFSKGFKRVELETARLFKLPASLRLFSLLSNQKEAITYSVEELRRMWGFDEKDPKTGEYVKYRDTSSFIKRVIEPARLEMEEKSPWSFTYRCNYSESSEVNSGRRGRKAITSITFFTERRVGLLSSADLISEAGGPLSVLDNATYNVLVNKLGFSSLGVRNNIVLFAAAKKVGLDLFTFLYEVAPKALRANNPAGYVIKSLETRLKEKYGVVKTLNGYEVPVG